MSVLIKGMKMPKDKHMTINIWADGHVYILGKNPMMLHDAAVELPDHGDLVDVDALKAECKEPYVWWETETQMARILKDAPVVIPAERSE